MCDIKELSKKSKELERENNKVISASGAMVLRAEKEVEEIQKDSVETMKRLSFLL